MNSPKFLCLAALIILVSCGGSDSGESTGSADDSGTETTTDESGSSAGDTGSTDETGSTGDTGSTDESGSVGDTGTTDESSTDSGTTDEGSGDVGSGTSDGGESSLGTLLFASGFEPNTQIDVKTPTFDRLSGKDNSVAQKGDWQADLVDGNPYIGSAKIFYEDKEGDRDKRRAELVTNELSTYMRYLIKRAHVEIVSPHDPDKKEIKGRIQLGLNNLEGLKEFTYRVKIRLAGGFNALTQAPQPITWMTLSEFWNDLSATKQSFRIHVAVHKGQGKGDLFWSVDGTEKIYAEDGTSHWEEVEGFYFPNQQFPELKAELDTWLELTVRVKEGLGEDGRFVATIGVPGEPAQVIADWHGPTVHPAQTAEELDGFDAIQPLKLYANGAYIEALYDMNAPALEVHWDDFELYEGFSEIQ